MSEAIDRARSVIEARLAEVAQESRELESALASLGASASRPRRKRPGRPKASGAGSRGKAGTSRKRKASKRAPRGQRREQLLAALKANPGARPADLACEIGISANQVHALIARTRKEKLVVRKGKGWAVKG